MPETKLVQTLEHVPAIVHGGPFANIAHGCNSVTATKCYENLQIMLSQRLDSVLTLCREILDIKCRMAGLHPSAVVIVATVRALNIQRWCSKADLNNENLELLRRSSKPSETCKQYQECIQTSCVVAINAFPTDTKAELDLVEAKCKELGVNVAPFRGMGKRRRRRHETC